MTYFLSCNSSLDNVIFKTKNIIVQKIQSGKKGNKCYIIGNGHSLSIGENNKITRHDPLMRIYKPKINIDDDVYLFFFTFECSGLEESSKDIAKFVNSLSDDFNQILLVGHSKCGLCLYNASYFCKKEIILVTVSTPFHGTFIADKTIAETILKYPLFIKIYNMIFSDHNVDRDIIPNSQFIQTLQKATYNEHINIVSSFRNIFSCRSILDFALFFLDRIMHIHGDGLVSISSQEINCTHTINISSSHATSLKKGLEIIQK